LTATLLSYAGNVTGYITPAWGWRIERGRGVASFTDILRYIDDAGLDAYQTRLLLHYWRVGFCFERQRVTADKCKMSLGQVSKTRQWLLDKGYITLATKKGKIGIELCSPHEQTQQLDGSIRSPHEQDVHHMNKNVHHMNAILSIPIEDNLLSLPTEETRPEEKQQDPHPLKQDEWYELQAAVSVVTKKQPEIMKPFELEDIDRLLNAGYTAAQIKTAYAKGKPDNYWANHWKTKGRFRVPTIQEIMDTIGEAVEWQPGQASTNGNGHHDNTPWKMAVAHARKGKVPTDPLLFAAVREFGWPRLQAMSEKDLAYSGNQKEFINVYQRIAATVQH
jgi:hypothetical protein